MIVMGIAIGGGGGGGGGGRGMWKTHLYSSYIEYLLYI